MNKDYSDIEIVRKYFNGELSAAERHDLEARALDDPFLMDAMDGYEQFAVKQQDIKELENRLANRIEEKEALGTVWGLKQWGIAASVIFGIALMSIYFNQTPEDKAIALTDFQKKSDVPTPIIEQEKSIEDSIIEEGRNEKSLTAIVNESPPIVMNQQKNNSDQVLRSYAPAEDILVEPMASSLTIDSVELKERMALEVDNQAKRTRNSALIAAKGEQMAALRKSRSSLIATNNETGNILKGRITDLNEHEALPGVSVTDTKTGITTQTDINGVFRLPIKEEASLKVSYLGFETQALSAKAKDSLNIFLKPDQKSLSEVVVVGYGNATKKSNDEILAGPNGGWNLFREYLDKNAKLPNNEKARVTVEFIITSKGLLTNFNILKSHNKIADDKAIELIKNYNGWHGSADGLPQKIKVTIRFK